MINFKTKPYKAVDMNRKAVAKCIETAGSVYASIKYDGVRGLLVAQPNESLVARAEFTSRVDKPIDALEFLGSDLWDHKDKRWESFLTDLAQPFKDGLMLDMELMVKGLSFNASSGLLRTKWTREENKKYHINAEALEGTTIKKSMKVPFCLNPELLDAVVFAVLPLEAAASGEDYDVMTCIMLEHVKHQVNLLKEYFPEIDWRAGTVFDVFSMEQLDSLFLEVREQDHEGLVVYDPLGVYKRGKKSGWWKMKPEDEADGIVQGPIWGTEGLANEGKVIGFEVLLETGRVVNVTNITQELMDEFTMHVLLNREYYNGWAVQIKFMNYTEDGSLRHPSFDKWRGTESNPKEKM